MIKLVFALRRRPDLSREEFQTYWREHHAPLVRSHAEALGIRRYVQVHTLPDDLHAPLRDSRGAPDAYDGVAELWFDSIEALGAAAVSDEGRAAAVALLEDERRFIDHAHSPLWLADEHPVVGPEVEYDEAPGP